MVPLLPVLCLAYIRIRTSMTRRGRMIESSAFKLDGTVFNVWSRTYDPSGRLIEISSTHFPKIVYSDFDSHGNWLKSISYKRIEKDGKVTFEPTEADYRAIKYY